MKNTFLIDRVVPFFNLLRQYFPIDSRIKVARLLLVESQKVVYICKSRVLSNTFLKLPFAKNLQCERIDCSATWTNIRKCEAGPDASQNRSSRNRRSTTRWARTATRRSAPAAAPSRRITWTTPARRRYSPARRDRTPSISGSSDWPWCSDRFIIVS